MMKRETSGFQECGPNLMAARDSMNRDEEERVAIVDDRRYGKEFDLCENYQNDADCLIQCEYINSIKTLQEQLVSKDEQLASKDEQIASLEEKLIQMSFELASSKAFQDEQLHQFKRRISSIESSSVDDANQCATSSQQQHQQQTIKTYQDGQAAVNYASVGFSQSRNSPRLYNPLHMRSSSWSVRDSVQHCEVDTTAWPQVTNEKNDPAPVGGRDPEPRQCSGVRLSRPAQRMSSSTIDDATSWMALDNCARKSLFSSTSSGLIGNHTAGNLHRAKEILPSDSTSTNGMRQRAATPNHGPAAPARRLARQLSSRQSSIYDSFTPSRFSNFGQFILGLNKNDKTTEEGAANEQTMNDQDDSPKGSSRSEIRGVVFPVSSDDCLKGLCQDDAIESSPIRNRRRCSSVNTDANVEWPEFR